MPNGEVLLYFLTYSLLSDVYCLFLGSYVSAPPLLGLWPNLFLVPLEGLEFFVCSLLDREKKGRKVESALII